MDIEKTLARILKDSPEPAKIEVRPASPKPRTAEKSASKPSETGGSVAHPAKRLFVIVTEDYSGLGWAKKLQEEGESVVLGSQMAKDDKEPERFKKVGENWIPRTDLSKAVKELSGKGAYWIFDSNKLSEISDKLRTKGEKVFGASPLSAKMEYDRAYGTKIAKEAGLDLPPTHAFSDISAGLKFLDAHPDTAYVFKPDASEFNYLTFVPFREKTQDANRELFYYLSHVPHTGKYILQERKYGIEVNVEVWLQKGEPFLAFVGLENKRRWNHDLGEMAGCAADIVFTIPVDSELVRSTIGKLLPFYKSQKHTGFVDVNVIIGDNEVWFLEVCNRFGYSSHPNLFINLALDGFGNIMADYMDGKVDKMSERFRPGFGASITLFSDHPREGIPLHIRKEWEHKYYPFDGYKDGDDLLLAGYSGEVGIFLDHDYTPEGAAEACLQKLFYKEAVSFPDMAFRTDLGKRDYTNAPIKRYEALRARKHTKNWD